MLNIDYSSFSYKGRRDYNQDSVVAKKIDDFTWVFAVADGMGGATGGGIASELAVSALMDYLENNLDSINSKNLKSMLKNGIGKANEILKMAIDQDSKLEGMGTTMVCLLMYKQTYAWASIGDSRIYRVNQVDFEQLTEDHSYVQDYLNKNGKDLPQNILDNYSHILTRCLDGKDGKPDIFPMNEDYANLKDDDCFLLCSDGLLLDRMNKNTELYKKLILGNKDISKAAKSLVGYAYKNGSADNISLVLVRAENAFVQELKTEHFELPKDEVVIKKKNWYQKFFHKD